MTDSTSDTLRVKIPFVERRRMQEVAKQIYNNVADNMLQWALEMQFEDFYMRGYTQGFKEAKQDKDTDDERGSDE